MNTSVAHLNNYKFAYRHVEHAERNTRRLSAFFISFAHGG